MTDHVLQPSHDERDDLRRAIGAHHELRRCLAEMHHLSVQQRNVPADRLDALFALVERKEAILREISELDAPTLFRASAALARRDDHDIDEMTNVRLALQTEADANMELWGALAESEDAAASRCASHVEELRKQLATAERAHSLRRAYGAPQAPPLQPRFVDRLR